MSEELGELAERFREHEVTLREVLEVTGGRGFDILLIILNLPFITPIPLPGISQLIGAVCILLALRLTLGMRPWLPDRLLDGKLPPRFFPMLLSATKRVLQVLEVLLRPRLLSFVQGVLIPKFNALLMFLMACCFILPLPIPLTNGLPAWAIILIAAGMLERDGLAVFFGYIVFVITTAYFTLIAIGGVALVEWMLSWLGIG